MSEALAGRGAPQGRVGTVIKGKWQIDARIGSGGMATVYAATHRNGNRAAIKMLHAQLSRDQAVRNRFLREGYVANAVGHPAVVAVLDDGETEDGAVFLVLELLEGETVDARRIRLGGKLPIDEALDIAAEALDALTAAHGKGIIHRDVKPENVFVCNDGRIKLLDFGLARMKDAAVETTQTGVTIGTPEFMPPEQAAGRRGSVDARSDIWGLGATIFTAITGRYVHDDATSLHEQLIASATRRSRPIRQLEPQVLPAVSLVIDRALELEMDDRWQSARDMKAALREARGRRAELSGESVTMHVAMPREPDVPSPPQSYDRPRPDVVIPSLAMPWGTGATAAEIEAAFESTQALSKNTQMLIAASAPEAPTTSPVPLAPISMPPATPPMVRPTARMLGHTPPFHAMSAPDGSVRNDLSPRPFAAAPNGPMFHPMPNQGGGAWDRDVPPSVRNVALAQQQPRRGSSAVLAIVALLMLAILAAAGSYALWRRGRLPR